MTETEDEARAALAERRKADERAFMIRGLDPVVAPRLSPALHAIRDLLADGEEHSFAEVVTTAARKSDLTIKTIDSTLRRLMTAQIIKREGEWTGGRGRVKQDTRRYTLLSWPGDLEGGDR